MPKRASIAFARFRAEVIRLVSCIPPGKFATYGSIAQHLKVNPRQVAFVLARLTEPEAGTVPWQRVVGAEGRLSQGMDPELRARQRRLLEGEGLRFDARDRIVDPDAAFHVVGPRREIRWDGREDPA